jgi:hypothetical protein
MSSCSVSQTHQFDDCDLKRADQVPRESRRLETRAVRLLSLLTSTICPSPVGEDRAEFPGKTQFLGRQFTAGRMELNHA